MSIIFKFVGGIIKVIAVIFFIGILVSTYFLNKLDAFQENNNLHSEKIQLTNQVKELSASLDTLEAISIALQRSRDGYQDKFQEVQKRNETYLRNLKHQEKQVEAQKQRISALTEQQHQMEETIFVKLQLVDSLNQAKQLLLVDNRKLNTENDELWQNSHLLKEELNKMKTSEQSLLAQNTLLLNNNQIYKEKVQKLEYVEAWFMFLQNTVAPIFLALICLVVTTFLWRKSILTFYNNNFKNWLFNRYNKIELTENSQNIKPKVSSQSSLKRDQFRRA